MINKAGGSMKSLSIIFFFTRINHANQSIINSLLKSSSIIWRKLLWTSIMADANTSFQTWKSNNLRCCTCRKCRQTPLGYKNVSKSTRTRHLKRERELVAEHDTSSEEESNVPDIEETLENVDSISTDNMSIDIQTRFDY